MVFFFESVQNRRSRNEDSYCHLDLRLNHEATVSAFAVADGMGGLADGGRFSKDAISLWYEGLLHVLMSDDFKGCSLKNQIDTLRGFSSRIFSEINEKLYQSGMNRGVRGGTTLSTAIHFWDMWIFVNCGDSPIYLMADGKITLCSELQNLAWKLVREHKTEIGSTLFYQNKNRLLEYLGRREEIHPHLVMMEDNKIETVIMGSDGAFGDLSMDKIGEILRDYEGRPEAINRLFETARDQGETDNQTAILIHCPENQTPKTKEEADIPEAEAVEPQYRKCEEEPLKDRVMNYLRRRRSDS